MTKVEQIHDFESFLQIYRYFEQFHFKRFIIDSLKVLFHNYLGKEIEISQIFHLFKERIPEKKALILSGYFQEKVQEAFGLFCKKISVEKLF